MTRWLEPNEAEARRRERLSWLDAIPELDPERARKLLEQRDAELELRRRQRRYWRPIMYLLEAMAAATGVAAFVALVTGELAWALVFTFAAAIAFEAASRLSEQ